MRHRPLVPLVLAFVGGLLAAEAPARLHADLGLILTSFLILPVMVLALAGRSRPWGFGALLALFVLAGGFLRLHDQGRVNTLLPGQTGKARITIQGTVLEPPQHRAQVTRFPVRVDRVVSGQSPLTPGDKLYISVYRHAPDLHPGMRIRFPARLRPFRNFNNPGGYDYERAMRIRGFAGAASISDGRRVVSMLPAGSLGWTGDLLERARAPVRTWIERSLPMPEQGLLRALILGEKQGLPPEVREAFQTAGLAHVLAVSGLHVGLVAWLAFAFFRWSLSRSYGLLLRVDVRKAAALATVLPVTGFAFLAGFQVSTQRAWIMVLAYLFSIAAGREKEVWSTLCLAALLVLAAQPQAIHTISFQLSFGAVAGILWLAPMFYRRIPNPFETRGQTPGPAARVMTYGIGLVSVTLAAVLFLLPLTVFYFHRVSLVSLPANLVVTPLLGLWVLPLGLSAVLLLPLLPSLASLVLEAASLGAGFMTSAAALFSAPERAALWVLTPNGPEVVLLYVFLISGVFAVSGRFRLLFLASCAALAADVGYWVHDTTLRRDLRITYLDVGQGNAALVRFPGGERMLVDGGGFRMSDFDVGRMVVAPYLWRQKITRIHTLVLSHPQADHMNGLGFIAEHFSPRTLWFGGDPVESEAHRRFLSIVRSARMETRVPGDPGIPEEIRGVRVELFHPLPGGSGDAGPVSNVNDRSLVLRLCHEGTSFLFAGDIEHGVEVWLAERFGSRLRSDVLLAPHHGSGTSSTRAFLNQVRPVWCVISAGAGNRFGFPHAGVLDRLRRAGIRIARTDRHGAVTAVAGGGRLSLRGTVGETLQEAATGVILSSCAPVHANRKDTP